MCASLPYYLFLYDYFSFLIQSYFNIHIIDGRGHVLLTRLRASAIRMCVCVCRMRCFFISRAKRLLPPPHQFLLLSFEVTQKIKIFDVFFLQEKKTFQIKSRHIGTAISYPPLLFWNRRRLFKTHETKTEGKKGLILGQLFFRLFPRIVCPATYSALARFFSFFLQNNQAKRKKKRSDTIPGPLKLNMPTSSMFVPT